MWVKCIQVECNNLDTGLNRSAFAIEVFNDDFIITKIIAAKMVLNYSLISDSIFSSSGQQECLECLLCLFGTTSQTENCFNLINVSVETLSWILVHHYFALRVDHKFREIPRNVFYLACLFVLETFCRLSKFFENWVCLLSIYFTLLH